MLISASGGSSAYARQLLAYSAQSGEVVSGAAARSLGKAQAATDVMALMQDTVQISDAGRSLAAGQS